MPPPHSIIDYNGPIAMKLLTYQKPLLLEYSDRYGGSGDYWPSTYKMINKVVPYLPRGHFKYCEPCAGCGRIIEILNKRRPKAICTRAFDILPREKNIQYADAAHLNIENVSSPLYGSPDLFITNLPWNKYSMYTILDNLLGMRPVWTAMSGWWIHSASSANYINCCKKIISIGPQKWIVGTKGVGKVPVVWCYFDPDHKNGPKFINARKPFNISRLRGKDRDIVSVNKNIRRKLLIKGEWVYT